MADKFVWIKAKGVNPVHLIDRMTIVEDEDGEKDYQRLSITGEMARQGVPLRVTNTMFIQGYYSDPINLLELVHDAAAAQKKHDEYFANRKVVVKDKQVEADAQKKAEERAILVARKAFDEEYRRVKEKGAGKSKVIRNKDEAAIQ